MKRMFRSISIFVLILLSEFTALASGNDNTESSFLDEAWENIKSPVTTDGKYFLMGGAGITAGLLLFRDQIVDPVQNDISGNKPLGDSSKYGDLAGKGVMNAAYILAAGAYGYWGNSNEVLRDASGMLQATLYSTIVTTTFKYTVRETRPDSNHTDSFPSGHTTAAFSFASYVACRHSWPWGVAAYTVATFVGISRINDNAHYLQDVVAGAAIGGSYGLGVCQQQDRQARKNSDASWFIVPTPQGATATVSFGF